MGCGRLRISLLILLHIVDYIFICEVHAEYDHSEYEETMKRYNADERNQQRLLAKLSKYRYNFKVPVSNLNDILDDPNLSLWLPHNNERHKYVKNKELMKHDGRRDRYTVKKEEQYFMPVDDYIKEKAVQKKYFPSNLENKQEYFPSDKEDISADDVATESTNDDQNISQPLLFQNLRHNEVSFKTHVSNAKISMTTVYLTAVATGCSVAGLVGVIIAVVCWYRLQKSVKAASDVEYPAYGTANGSNKDISSPGDRKLAHSAQMYHYQHQKQQMIALEIAKNDLKDNGTDDDSEEENEEGDYTVYECPGLAPTGEMEVKNPLFSEETPSTPTADGVMK